VDVPKAAVIGGQYQDDVAVKFPEQVGEVPCPQPDVVRRIVEIIGLETLFSVILCYPPPCFRQDLHQAAGILGRPGTGIKVALGFDNGGYEVRIEIILAGVVLDEFTIVERVIVAADAVEVKEKHGQEKEKNPPQVTQCRITPGEASSRSL